MALLICLEIQKFVSFNANFWQILFMGMENFLIFIKLEILIIQIPVFIFNKVCDNLKFEILVSSLRFTIIKA